MRALSINLVGIDMTGEKDLPKVFSFRLESYGWYFNSPSPFLAQAARSSDADGIIGRQLRASNIRLTAPEVAS